jgi:glucose-6-phosphate 1-dehydrogenase
MNTTDQLDPAVFVIFGGAGDLTWRKLVPALFNLHRTGACLLGFPSLRWIAWP